MYCDNVFLIVNYLGDVLLNILIMIIYLDLSLNSIFYFFEKIFDYYF